MPLMDLSENKDKIKRIGIDICTLGDGKLGIETAGIQNFLTALLNQLQYIDDKNEYFLFETRESQFKCINPKWKKLVLPTFLPGIVWMQLIFPFYLLRYKIDVLWSPKFICPLWRFKRIRTYTTIHDLTTFHYPQTRTFRENIIMRFFIPWSIKRSTAVFAVSDFVKKDIEMFFKYSTTTIFAIPNGKPEWNIPNGYRVENRCDFLFFAGNLEPRKNLLLVIRALEKLYLNGKSIELQIASPSGWKNRELLDYIERSPIKPNIKLLGFISVTDLQQKYLSCRALVYPSLYEGFGLPVLEALTMDCIVITSQNTVMQEIAGESAIYFNPFDRNDLAEKIRFVYSEAFKREFYLKHKNNILEKYSWETAAQRLRSVFESSNDI